MKGETGVGDLLTVFAEDLVETLQLTGCRSVSAVERDVVRPAPQKP